MKTLSIASRLLLSLTAFCFFFAVALPGLAATDDPINSALPAAKAWLALIDSGKYEESYDAAGQGLYQKVPNKKEWETSLKIIRSAWGGIVERKESQHLYQPNGIVGLNGECMAIAFDTTTKKQPNVVEMVIMRMEDGKWRGVGYTMGVKNTSQTPEGEPAAVSQTTSNVIPNGAKPAPAKSH